MSKYFQCASFPIYLTVLLAISGMPLYAQSPDAKRDAAILIVETAEGICGVSQTEGSGSKLELDGEAEASVAILSKRLLGLGIEGGANLQESEYKNVLREQLADELKDARQCRQDVFDKMFSTVFESPARSVLKEDTDEVLAGTILPHQIEIISSGQQFVMKPNESVALGNMSRMFTIKKVVNNRNLGPLVYYNWVDTTSGNSVTNRYAQQTQPIALKGCNITPYRIEVEAQSVSFVSTCER